MSPRSGAIGSDGEGNGGEKKIAIFNQKVELFHHFLAYNYPLAKRRQLMSSHHLAGAFAVRSTAASAAVLAAARAVDLLAEVLGVGRRWSSRTRQVLHYFSKSTKIHGLSDGERGGSTADFFLEMLRQICRDFPVPSEGEPRRRNC